MRIKKEKKNIDLMEGKQTSIAAVWGQFISFATFLIPLFLVTDYL
jgi:hypothetical protein